MIVFDKAEDLIKILPYANLRAPLKIHSLNYPTTSYKCGCSKKEHILADPSNVLFANASKKIFTVIFVIKCRNDFYSLVTIKGIFKQKAETAWTVSKKIMNDYLKLLRLPDIDSIIK
jgi:hypothetical protein